MSAPQSGTEPPSGVLGTGTTDQPYDGGNAPEQQTLSGTEPPSGIQGKGTVDQPYDQGNKPAQLLSSAATQPTTTSASVDPVDSPAITHQGSANTTMEPTKEQEQVVDETRGRDEAAQQTTSTGAAPAPQGSGHFDASRKQKDDRYEERDVSPGEMRDGTHVQTSGDRGEGYKQSKGDKLKSKFFSRK